MNQKLSDWASIAEIASGIAVVVTLILLFSGIRDNTEVTRTAMYADALGRLNAFETEILLDPELVPVYGSYLIGDPSGLDSQELERAGLIIAVLFRMLDIAFTANQNRQLGDEEWARMERSLCTNYKRAEAFGHLATVEFLTTASFLEFATRTCNQVQVTLPGLHGETG